jgi:rare lipoprotein A
MIGNWRAVEPVLNEVRVHVQHALQAVARMTVADHRVVLAAASISLLLSLGAAPAKAAGELAEDQPSPKRIEATPKKIDRSGKARVGKASFYAKGFAGKKMADGTPMDPQDDNAASKTLPLGTTAKVTNLETGKSAVVTIQDRGPYVDGRIVDLSPSTAREIGLTRKQGVADVKVEPIAVPMPDGTVKPGVAAAEKGGGWFDWFR